MKLSTIAMIALLAGSSFTSAAFAQHVQAVRTVSAWNLEAKSKLAIKGYDPVAYFDESKPVKGSADFIHEWMGAKWRFASAAHRDAFAAAPETYAPQFGGYCAWAVSQGYTAGIDPEAWKIIGGKLYLNYDLKVQKMWEADTAKHIAAGEKNWPEILKK
jgi:YHS domain-containing protein